MHLILEHDLQDDWNKEKREFLNNLSRLPHAPSSVGGPTSSTNAIQPYQGSTAITTRPQDITRGSESMPATQQDMVARKAAAYANVVMRLNESRERSLPFKVRLIGLNHHERVSICYLCALL